MNASNQADFDACEDHRELVQAGEFDQPQVRLHLNSCAACAALADRVRRLQGALGQLGRRTAPQELHSLVAEALAQGPTERLLGQLRRVRPPQVLDRLVAEEVAAPQLHTIRRTMDGLPRLAAPAGVAQFEGSAAGQRVGGRRVDGQRAGAARVTLARRALVGLLAAGALGLVWIRWDGAAQGTPVLALGSQVERPPLRLKAVVLVSPDRLDPMAQAFATGLGGGAPLTLPPVPR